MIQAFQSVAETSERLTRNKTPHDNCRRMDRATLHSKFSVGKWTIYNSVGLFALRHGTDRRARLASVANTSGLIRQ